MEKILNVLYWAWDLWRRYDEEKEEPDPQPQPDPPAPDPGFPVSQTFLSKPISNDGHYCALTPERIKKKDVKRVQIHNGVTPWKMYYPKPEKGMPPKSRNGGRLHHRFRKAGAEYGGPGWFRVFFKNGTTETFSIPDMGARHEANYPEPRGNDNG